VRKGVDASLDALETVVSGRLGQVGLKRFPEFGPTDVDFADAAAELERLGCQSLAEKPFGILSQGERQQTLIARARMARPLLMVLDEPCAGMDPGVRERFLAWLNERLLQPETPTVVLVTHHLEEIVPGIQNTLLLSDGRIRAAGRPQRIDGRDGRPDLRAGPGEPQGRGRRHESGGGLR